MIPEEFSVALPTETYEDEPPVVGNTPDLTPEDEPALPPAIQAELDESDEPDPADPAE